MHCRRTLSALVRRQYLASHTSPFIVPSLKSILSFPSACSETELLTPRTTKALPSETSSRHHVCSGHCLSASFQSTPGALLVSPPADAVVLQWARLALWLHVNRSLGKIPVRRTRFLIRARTEAQPAIPFGARSFSPQGFAGPGSMDLRRWPIYTISAHAASHSAFSLFAHRPSFCPFSCILRPTGLLHARNAFMTHRSTIFQPRR
jgi:hypothetical protein